MLEVILAGNIEAGRLEAEVRDEQYDLIAIVYEDNDGWHIEQQGADRIPDDLLKKIKEDLGSRPNRKGNDAPEGMSRGEYSLWLLD
jgi:hypothetical protein